MEHAALIAIEIGAIEENASTLHDPRFAIPVEATGERPLLSGLLGELPALRVELLDPLRDVAFVLLARKVGTEGAAAVIWPRGVDALAPVSKYAGPPGRQPSQVSADPLVRIGRVAELDPLPRKIKGNLRHSCSLDG